MDKTLRVLKDINNDSDVEDFLLLNRFSELEEDMVHAILSENLLFIINEMTDRDLINACILFSEEDHYPRYSDGVGEWLLQTTSNYTIDQALPVIKEAVDNPHWTLDYNMYEEFLATLHVFLWRSMVKEVLFFYSNNRRRLQLKEAFNAVRVCNSQQSM